MKKLGLQISIGANIGNLSI